MTHFKNPINMKIFYTIAMFVSVVLLFSITTAYETSLANQTEISSDEMIDNAAVSETELTKPEKVERELQAPGVIDFLVSGKYIAFFLLMIVGLALLFGRWINIWVRVGMMLVAFVLFGLDFYFPLHPSPMCGVTKLFMFKFTLGSFFPAFVAIFLAIFIPSLLGRKLFCGWVCPLGALQELVNKIPHKFKWKQFNFKSFNAVRMSLLGLFVISFFYVKDMMAGLGANAEVYINEPVLKAYSAYSIYEPINFFELLHWNLTTTFIIMLIILVVASLILYRPFCYFICPIGALTWLIEKIAPGRIRVDHSSCNQCGICVEESPCPTIEKIIDEEAKCIPDCTSCGECLNTCPEDAIYFGLKRK